MSILAFQMPEKVVMEKSDDFTGTFEFKPLEKGYGVTIGNALRRILLSSLEGFAIGTPVANRERPIEVAERIIATAEPSSASRDYGEPS